MARPSAPARGKASDVSVDRVYDGDVYARVSTVGADGERAFVLVPGIGVMSNYFERLAFRLVEFGPVIALDLPGFGGVKHPKRPMSVEQYADLVGSVVDQLGLRDPILVGHSMGTQIVAALARRRELTDLVLISPVVNRHERRRRTVLLRFAQSAVHEPPKVAAMAIYAYLLCGFGWIFRVLPNVLRYKIEDVLPDITADTLVVTGEEDRLVPLSWVQEVAELLPHAQVWRIPGAAHSVMHGNAEDVARLCVAHARRDEPDDDRVRRVPHRQEDEPSTDLPTAVKSLKGQATELAGILTDDDDLMAKGQTEHAEAAEAAAGPPTTVADEPDFTVVAPDEDVPEVGSPDTGEDDRQSEAGEQPVAG